MSLLINKLNTKAVSIDGFVDPVLDHHKLTLDVLRLDKIHPVVSGNKLYKLDHYFEEAISTNYNSVETVGGYFSNHIVATAFAAQACGLKSYGLIRGEEPAILSPALRDATNYGMKLRFLARDEYDRNKRTAGSDHYFIPEGGYGEKGVKGAAEILNNVADLEQYNFIISAVGTGTMFAGLVRNALPHQHLIGISAFKNNLSLETEVQELTGADKKFQLIHDYHFGGFAKHPAGLLTFMKKVWETNHLPTDIVYTSKTLYAILDLAKNNFFPHGSKVLMIHSGGLQGNRSLPVDSLPFL